MYVYTVARGASAPTLCQCDYTVLAGENALSPCISVRTAITIDSHTTAGGQLQHCLAVPRLAVATALMELPPDIRSMVSRFEGGVLMGALGFQATLTLPIMASGMLTAATRHLVLLMHNERELQLLSWLVITLAFLAQYPRSPARTIAPGLSHGTLIAADLYKLHACCS